MGMWEVSFLHPRQPVWVSGRSQTPESSPQRCWNPSPSSNVGDYGFKTTAHALFTKLASKMLLTSCHPNLSPPIHLEILLRTTLTQLWLTPFLLPSLFRSHLSLPNLTLLWKPSRSAWTLETGQLHQRPLTHDGQKWMFFLPHGSLKTHRWL